MINILVVSGSFYSTERLVQDLGSALGPNVRIVAKYRDYHAKESAPWTDIIVGDGTCKTRDEFGTSMPIQFDGRKLASEHGKVFVKMRRRETNRSTRAVRRIAKRIRRQAKKRGIPLTVG